LTPDEINNNVGVKGFPSCFLAMLPPEVVAKLDKKGRFGTSARTYADLLNTINEKLYLIHELEDDLVKETQLSRVAAEKAKAEVNKAMRSAVAAVAPPPAAPVKLSKPARKTTPSASAPPPSYLDDYSDDDCGELARSPAQETSMEKVNKSRYFCQVKVWFWFSCFIVVKRSRDRV
jgi:hypothetical protein